MNNLFGRPEEEDELLQTIPMPAAPAPVPEEVSLLPEPAPAPTSAPLADLTRDVESKKNTLTMIDGIAQMFGGSGKSTQGVRADLDKSLHDARNKNKYQLDSDMADPTSRQSQLYRTLAKSEMIKLVPPEQQAEFAKHIDAMPADELKEFMKAQRKNRGESGKPQLKAVQRMVNGKPKLDLVWFYPDGSKQETGEVAGYKLNADIDSGLVASGSDATNPASPIVGPDGRNTAAIVTDVEAGRKAQTTLAGDIAKTEGQLAEAKAYEHDFTEVKSPRWKQLHELSLASKTGGPLTSRLAKFAQDFGFAPDEAGAILREETALWGNEYVNKITGAAMTLSEFKERFQPVLIQQSDTPTMVQNKLRGLAQSIKDRAAELGMASELKKQRLQEGVLTPRGEQPQQKIHVPGGSGTTSPERKTVKRKAKNGKVAIFDAETKEFIGYEGE